MDYGAIVRRAWEITKKYRFIWWLGLLAILAEGGMSGFNGASPNFLNSLNHISPTPTATVIYQPNNETNDQNANVPEIRVLSGTTERNGSETKNYDPYFVAGMVVFAILGIALFIILL